MGTSAQPKTTAIIVAAGSSSRMGRSVGDKIFAELRGKPVLLYSLEAFQTANTVDEIIVVCNDAAQVRAWKIPKVVQIVSGGRDRRESVQNGISALIGGEVSEISLNAVNSGSMVAIHDGARPLITPKLIDETVRAAKMYKAAIPAVPVKDTVKRVKRERGAPYVGSTPDRTALYSAQTPQTFELRLYCEAMRRACQSGGGFPVTDDSMLIERMGEKVAVVEGDRSNIKITTPEDLLIAEAFLNDFV